jgi:hypothetical protein
MLPSHCGRLLRAKVGSPCSASEKLVLRHSLSVSRGALRRKICGKKRVLFSYGMLELALS